MVFPDQSFGDLMLLDFLEMKQIGESLNSTPMATTGMPLARANNTSSAPATPKRSEPAATNFTELLSGPPGVMLRSIPFVRKMPCSFPANHPVMVPAKNHFILTDTFSGP